MGGESEGTINAHIVTALSTVTADLLERIRGETASDNATVQLLKQVKEGIVKHFWIENGVLYAKGR